MARGKSISSLVGNTSAVCGEDFLRKSCYTFLGRHIKPDQTETGKFIATLRKEKGLTQEKLGEKLGEEQADAIISDAADLCNGLCEEYKGLSEKEKVHTERMIFLFTGIKPEGCDGDTGDDGGCGGFLSRKSPHLRIPRRVSRILRIPRSRQKPAFFFFPLDRRGESGYNIGCTGNRCVDNLFF